MTTMRRQIRDYVRRLFGLDPAPPRGSLADHRARKQARLTADAARWAKYEREERERRKFDTMLAEEMFRVRLQRKGSVFPEDD